MLTNVARIILVSLLLSGGIVNAQDRVSCNILKSLDLKPLLGADHGALVTFAPDSCRTESKSPGRYVVLGIMQGTAAELQKMFAMIKKIHAKSPQDVTVVAEPSLGPDAFSVREKEMRHIEIMVLKGARGINLQGGHNKPLSDAEVKQLVALAKAALDKLP